MATSAQVYLKPFSLRHTTKNKVTSSWWLLQAYFSQMSLKWLPLQHEEMRNWWRTDVLSQDGCGTLKSYIPQPMSVFLALFPSSASHPYLWLPTSAVYFESCIVQPLLLYRSFPLHPLSESLPPPSHSRRLNTLNRTTFAVLCGCLDYGEFWNSSTRQTCCCTPLMMCYNCRYIMGQWDSYRDTIWSDVNLFQLINLGAGGESNSVALNEFKLNSDCVTKWIHEDKYSYWCFARVEFILI